jgi:hypothetical protein
MLFFHWCAESPESPEIFSEYPDFLDIPDFPRTVRTFKHQISLSSLVECIICHEHITLICCMSQAPH